MNIYYPRWFFPANLGDSVQFTWVPKFLKEIKNTDIEVQTWGDLVTVLNSNGDCKAFEPRFREEYGEYYSWKQMSNNPSNGSKLAVVFPEWHPKVWEYWNDNWDLCVKHPTANILTVNTLLQLNQVESLKSDFDFTPIIKIPPTERDNKVLAIVPATKLSGRPTPHQGCDGKGFRFNGEKGFDSWTAFCKRIKELDSKIEIREFSPENFGFGDTHIPHMNLIDLATACAIPKVVVCSDGGMRHVFHSQGTPIVYLAAQSINKPWHYKSKNTTVYWDLYSKCLDRCEPTIKKLKNWEGLNECCNLDCEKVDPIELANRVYTDFYA